MVIIHLGQTSVCVVKVAVMVQWKEREIVQILSRNTEAWIALTWAPQRRQKVATYFLVRYMAIFLHGHYLAFAAKAVEMVKRQELDYVQILFHNMAVKAVLRLDL